MPTSDCCRPELPRQPRRVLRGFTLLEVLVVLAVLSLLAALAAPQLYRTYQSVTARGERDAIIAQLAALSLRAQALGVAFVLSADSASGALPDGQPLIALPSGWQLRTERPIRFNFVGMCSGGTVRLRSPSGEQFEIVLDAPACEVHAPATVSGRL
jgi:general secretion pathway protein G